MPTGSEQSRSIKYHNRKIIDFITCLSCRFHRLIFHILSTPLNHEVCLLRQQIYKTLLELLQNRDLKIASNDTTVQNTREKCV